jgi:hypothetical protein
MLLELEQDSHSLIVPSPESKIPSLTLFKQL